MSITSNLTHEIQLPSKGLLNPEIPEGKIVQRCMMLSDQKFLAGSKLSGDLAIQELLRRCTETPENIDVSALTVPDSLYMLFKLRSLSYGDKYTFRTKCPECGSRIDVTIDLSELEVVYLEPGYEKNLHVVLPHKGDTVYTKLMTNRDFSEIEKDVRRMKKRFPDSQEDFEISMKLAAQIVRIKLQTPREDGTKELDNPIDILQYVEKLTDLDATAIKSTTENVVYGIRPTVEKVCPNCNEIIDVNVQFGPQFFRPKFSNN